MCRYLCAIITVRRIRKYAHTLLYNNLVQTNFGINDNSDLFVQVVCFSNDIFIYFCIMSFHPTFFFNDRNTVKFLSIYTNITFKIDMFARLFNEISFLRWKLFTFHLYTTHFSLIKYVSLCVVCRVSSHNGG